MAIPFNVNASVPPLVEQFGLDRGADAGTGLPPFWEGIYQGMLEQMREIGLLSERATSEWITVAKTHEQMLASAREAADELVALRRSPEERQQDMAVIRAQNLPDVIKDRVINFLDSLGVYGEQYQTSAAADVSPSTLSADQLSQYDRARSEGRISTVAGWMADSDPDFKALLVEATSEGVTKGIQDANEERAKDSDRRPAHEDRARGVADVGPIEDAIESGRVDPSRDRIDRHRREGFPEGVAASGPPPPPGGGDDPSDPTRKVPWNSWGEGRQAGGDVDSYRKVLVDRTKGKIDKWASEWGVSDRVPDGVADFDGKWGWANPEEGAAYEAAMGRYGPGAMSKDGIWQWENVDDAAAWQSQSNRFGRIQGALDAYGAGEGVSGAVSRLAPAAGRALGVAGAIYGGVELATGFAESQRAANNTYTSVYGAGQGDAYGQRAQEMAFSRLAMMGTMDAQQASALYRDVAETGWRGENRSAALDFAVSNYRDFGMETRQSVEFIRMATQEGSEALDSYRQGLIAVSESAKESGESIKQAHQDYLDTIKAAKEFTSGAGAAQLSAALTGVGQELDSTGLADVDLLRMISTEDNITRYAMAQGLDYGTVESGLQSGDPNVTAGLLQQSQADFVRFATGGRRASPEAQARIDQIMRESGGRPSNEQVREIITLLQSGPNPVFQSRNLDSIAGSMGLNMTQEQMAQFIARTYAGDERVDFSQAMAQAETDWKKGGLGVEGLRPSLGDELFGGAWTDRRDKRAEWGLQDAREDDAWWEWRFGQNTIDNADPIYKATDRYFDLMKSGEQEITSPNLESVFSYIGGLEDKGEARSWAKKRFVTTGDDGQEVEFGIEDLPNYIRQVEAGGVSIIGEGGRRTALQDITGYVPSGGGQAAPQTVKVEVEAKGALKDALNVRYVGGVENEAARATGTSMRPFGTPGLKDGWVNLGGNR